MDAALAVAMETARIAFAPSFDLSFVPSALIICVNVRCVHANDGIVNDRINVFYSLRYALAKVSRLVTVAKL